MEKKYYITWSEFHRDVQALVWNLPRRQWKGIVAITRGGLVPTALLAKDLDIKHIETVCISSYDDASHQQSKAVVIKGLPPGDDGTDWLVVDDLVDTGATIKIIKNMFPRAFYATVYAKAQGKVLVDTYVSEINAWIVFPWEEDAPERLMA